MCLNSPGRAISSLQREQSLEGEKSGNEKRGKNSVVLMGLQQAGALISTSGSGPGGTTGFISRRFISTGGLISTGSGPGGTTGSISRESISTGGLISTGGGPGGFPAKIFAPKAENFRARAMTVWAVTTCGVSAVAADRRPAGKTTTEEATLTCGLQLSPELNTAPRAAAG